MNNNKLNFTKNIIYVIISLMMIGIPSVLVMDSIKDISSRSTTQYIYEKIEAEIIDKQYEPSRYSSSSGVIMGSNQVVGGGSYTPERWIVIYKELDSGKIKSKSLDSEFYYKYNIGDVIVVGTNRVPIYDSNLNSSNNDKE